MLLSIIIPVYNAEYFIERCVNSILDQSEKYNDIELILINDGSTDSSLKILNDSYSSNALVTIYDKDNSGQGDTRNIGWEKATGKYIWFIDADVYLEGNIIDNIYKTINSNTPDTILLGFKSVDLDGNTLFEFKYNFEELTREKLIQQSLYKNTVWSKVINAKLIEENKLKFDTTVKTAEDFHFSFRALYFSEKIISLEGAYYNYVVNPNSISNIRSKEHLEKLAIDSVIVAKNINDFLNKNHLKYNDRKKTFKPWLNVFLYGLLFSLFRFNYDIEFISEIIEKMKKNHNYPIDNSNMNFKKKIFTTMANKKLIFLNACKLSRSFN